VSSATLITKSPHSLVFFNQILGHRLDYFMKKYKKYQGIAKMFVGREKTNHEIKT
jgi:hypothetical protein